MHNIGKVNFALLCLGLFSQTYVRLIGSIAISELIIFVMAPFVFAADNAKLKRNGFMPYIFCVILAMVGCAISSIANNSPFPLVIRGFASTYALFAIPVVLHRYISRDMSGYRWFIVGLSISCVISVFGFHSGVEVAEAERLGGGIGESELYFLRHFGALFAMWYEGWYLKLPTWLTCVLMLIPIVVTVSTTSTGRSAIGLAIISIFMIIYARRRRVQMRKLGRHLFGMAIGVLIIASCAASAYKYAATKGLLNERAQRKYEAQAKKGGGIKNLIMSGRGVCFAGLIACMDKPILGHGPWAVDDGRYWSKYLRTYGDEEEYIKAELRFRKNAGLDILIPAHSHIVGFWVWYGLLGLPIWIYVLIKLLENFVKYSWAVPQWFILLSVALPGIIWTILFSPFSTRMPMCLTITLLHLSIAVGKGKIVLPLEMQTEVLKSENR